MSTHTKIEIRKTEHYPRMASTIFSTEDGYKIEFDNWSIGPNGLIEQVRDPEYIKTDQRAWQATNNYVVIPSPKGAYVVGPGSVLLFEEFKFGKDEYSQAAMEYFETELEVFRGNNGVSMVVHTDGVVVKQGRVRVELGNDAVELLKSYFT